MPGLEVIGKGKLRCDANVIAEEYRMSRLKEACRTAILAQLDLIDGLLRAYGTLDEKEGRYHSLFHFVWIAQIVAER